MTDHVDPDSALKAVRIEAIRWAAGARAQPLVAAAADALAAGLDSPTLRVLAGAPRAFADDEARDLAPAAFEELGLTIAPRLSQAAVIDWSRLRAAEFLAGKGSARELAKVLYAAFVSSGYCDELADWSGLDDEYDLVDLGYVTVSHEELDEAVAKAAENLAR